MVSGRITGRPPSFSAPIMDIVVLIARVNLPIEMNLDVPVYLGSSPSTQWNGLREMGPVVVSGSGHVVDYVEDMIKRVLMPQYLQGGHAGWLLQPFATSNIYIYFEHLCIY